MKTILYARYSTERQSEASIADQLRTCRQYAESQGWLVDAEHADEGISGAAIGNRPGVRRAMDALQRGDTLLVTDLSRLSRSQDLAPLLARLRHRGARVIGVQDAFDSDSRTARMQAGMSGIMSEEFRTMIGDRTRSALDMRARLGRPTGGKAYGNTEIVREIFTRFAACESMKSIATDLNRRDIPSPGANWKSRSRPRGRWLVSALHAMLKNERYIGRLVWNKSQWVKDPDTGIRHRRERPESEWIVRECAPIIDRTVWDRAQARFQARAGGPRGVLRCLLSGVLECDLCSGKMIVVGGDQRRYVCGTNHAGGIHACANSTSFPRLLAEEAVLAPVMDDLLSPAAVAAGIHAMKEARVAPLPPEPQNREIIELERLVRQGLLSPETAEPALAEARRKAAESRVINAQPVPLPWPSERGWRQAVAGMRQILEGEDTAAAREVLLDLIGPVRCPPAENGIVHAKLTTRQVFISTALVRRTGTDGAGGMNDVYGFKAGPRYQSIYFPEDHGSGADQAPIIIVRIPVSSRKRGVKP